MKVTMKVLTLNSGGTIVFELATLKYVIELSPHFNSLTCSASTIRSNVRSRAGPLPMYGTDTEFRSSFCLSVEWKLQN